MWGRGVLPAALPAPFSATPSPALSVYLRKCGAAGSASGRTACPIHPTLRQSRSRYGQCESSPSHLPVSAPPTSLDVFPFHLLGVGLPCHSTFRQLLLCEEAQWSTYAAILVLNLFKLMVISYVAVKKLIHSFSSCTALLLPYFYLS